MENSKHTKYLQTISFIYYQKLNLNFIKDSEIYFKSKIVNSLFYGLEKEFFTLKYVVPKERVGLRHYIFFSYSMYLIYYSIGLYLANLTQDFQEDYVRSHPQIQSFYGGRIKYSNKELQVVDFYHGTYRKDFEKKSKLN